MFTKLMPKEEKYFEYFQEMIRHIAQMANATHALFSSRPLDKGKLLDIMPLEKRCDEILRKVVKQLNKTFITPFDREDILILINRLDDISDVLFAAAVRVDVFQLEEPIEGADKLTEIVTHQIRELEKVLENLRHRKGGSDECKAVKDLETEADTVYRSLMKKLFQEEKDPIALMKKKELLDILEEASDKCQGVANVIVSIFIKNS